MFKSVRKFFSFSCFFSDLISLFLSFFIAYFLRANIFPLIPYFAKRDFFPIFNYLPVFLISSFFIILTLYIIGGYKLPLSAPFHQTLLIVFKSSILSFLLTISSFYLLKLVYVSRTFVAILFFSFIFVSSFLRYFVLIKFRKGAKEGIYHRELVLIGNSQKAKDFINTIKGNSDLGFSIKGFFLPSKEENDEEIEYLTSEGLNYLGTIDDLSSYLEREIVDTVVITEDYSKIPNLEEIFITCEELGIELVLSLKIFPHVGTPIYFERIENIPLLHFSMTPKVSFSLFLKRVIDIIGSLLGLIIFSPLMIIVALLIKLTSEGPIFFVQERMGLRGRRFKLYKFRTMVKDAEKKLEEIKHLNEADGPVFKIEKDPRLTPIGSFLRKSSIDELPQLINVLKGEMSLVGPRPPIPSEVEKYERWQKRRLSMKPGLTCLWQISGRSELDFDTWMKLDLEYIDNWSLTLDFIILLKTIPAVLSGRGAK